MNNFLFGFEQTLDQETFLDDVLLDPQQFSSSPPTSFSFTSFSGDADFTESSLDDSGFTPEYSSPELSPNCTPQPIVVAQNAFNGPASSAETPVPNLPSPADQHSSFLANSCKKRKLDGPENIEIILPRDILRKTSCEELDEQVKLVTQYRELTPVEEYAISRQRRLIKSRQYANNARNKKKQESETLRQENDRLISEKNSLTQTMTALQQENLRLLAENNQFRLMLGNMGISCPPAYSAPLPGLATRIEPKTTINLDATSQSFSPISYIGSNFQKTQPLNAKTLSPKNLTPSSAMGMTTVVLFVILFSFALFTLPNALSSIPGFEYHTQSSHFTSHSARRILDSAFDLNPITTKPILLPSNSDVVTTTELFPCSPTHYHNYTFIPHQIPKID